MSCGPEAQTFRLLDGYVGWEAVDSTGLEGLDEGGAIRLGRLLADALDPGEILPWLPPPSLARGCGPCEWYLVSAAPTGGLLRQLCSDSWEPAAGALGRTGALADGPELQTYGRLVAARGHELAVSDPAAGRMWLLGRGGDQTLAVIDVAEVRALAFTSWHELLVAVAGEKQLRRYDRIGAPLGQFLAPLPAGNVVRLAVGGDCAVWIVVDRGDAWHLYRAARTADVFRPATVDELALAFPKSAVSASGPAGFCLTEPGRDGLPETRCYDWTGQLLDGGQVTPPPPPARYKRGQLLAGPIDSGFLRCRWHRVRIDADVPPSTSCWVEVATSEDPSPPDQGAPDRAWPGFPMGPLHPDDWQGRQQGDPLDFLVRQPPGRYLFLRLRLVGDGVATPTVRRIRIDLPRSTSLERLPSVYRETPEAEDFSERFLSLFDATIEQIDQAIVRAPALLDAGGVPDEVLPWLGAFLDIAFDAAWSPTQRRQLLQKAPALYKMRGTRQGLIETIRVLTGVAPTIVELALARSWGILSQDARVGEMRLFGRSSARFRVGSSKLGGAPLKSFGDPGQDPVAVEAFRFQVLLPPNALGPAPNARARLAQLVASIKPAHTVASLRIGGGGFVLGVSSAVGVDTVLGGLPPTVLGTIRLSRQSVLAPSRKGRRIGFTVGAAAVGIHTRMQ